jgi:hypothetical protein
VTQVAGSAIECFIVDSAVILIDKR